VSSPVIELRSVVKDYSGTPPLRVLHGIDLAIQPGELLAVVGASGSGKSTMLAIMGTLDDPTSGTVRVEGRDVAKLRESDRAALRARRIGFVFQQFFLLPALSAVDNVALGLLYSGVAVGERTRRAVEALARVGLATRRFCSPTSPPDPSTRRRARASSICSSRWEPRARPS
jgi:putative ABC transport system ATP-binding protein